MKKFIILIMLFCLTGCTIDYELKISNSLEFNEKITFIGSVSDFGTNTTEEFIFNYVDDFLTDGYKFTTKQIKNNQYKFVVENQVIGKDDFIKSESLNKLYNNSEIYTNSKGNIVFDLKRYDCFDEDACTPLNFNSINITITSQKKIINSNADKITNGGTKYIWNFSNSNIKNIYFELTEDRNYNYNYIIVACVLIVIIVVTLLFTKKIKKSNEI